MAMQDMTAIEVKAFVPSKDFALSKRFYEDLGWRRVAVMGRRLGARRPRSMGPLSCA